MRILITGGLGFIGSHLVEALLTEGHEITILDNLYYNQQLQNFKFKGKANIIIGDVGDIKTVEESSKEIDLIFHLAAVSNIKQSIEDPECCVLTNILGTLNVLHAAHKNKAKKVIFSSSREVYGNPSSLPVKEETPLNPVNLYGLSKKCSESICDFFRKQCGMNIAIFRLSNVYGKGDPGKTRVIPSFLRKIKNRENLEINGGNQILDFVYIDDVIKVFLDSLTDYENKTLNIGSGKGTSITELAKLLLSLTKSNVKINYNSKIQHEVDNYIADISKIDIEPISLKEGLAELIKTNSY